MLDAVLNADVSARPKVAARAGCPHVQQELDARTCSVAHESCQCVLLDAFSLVNECSLLNEVYLLLNES